MKTLLTKTAPVPTVNGSGKSRKHGSGEESVRKSRRFRPRGYVVILDMKAVMK
jgi:hypothetical protein